MSYPYTPSWFSNVPHYHPIKQPEEGDLIDPRTKLEGKCLSSCSHWISEYAACVRRVRARKDGKGNCLSQYEELAMCQDHCIAHDLFTYLK